jgi:hypothetical protein
VAERANDIKPGLTDRSAQDIAQRLTKRRLPRTLERDDSRKNLEEASRLVDATSVRHRHARPRKRPHGGGLLARVLQGSLVELLLDLRGPVDTLGWDVENAIAIEEQR